MATSTKSASGANAANGNASDPAAPAGASILVGDTGNTIVHNQVVATIAGLAV